MPIPSFKSRFKMIARSVGYRMGKASAERARYGKQDEWMPDFSELFAPEYIPDAEFGYDEGLAFVRERVREYERRGAELSRRIAAAAAAEAKTKGTEEGTHTV